MISIISDVHIKKPGDQAYKLLLSFFDHPEVLKSKKIILLGDIFDLLVGGNKSFINDYREVFDKIQGLAKEGREVFYIEGNHDFHLNNFFKENFNNEFFSHSKEKLKITCFDKTIVFCHGDDIELKTFSHSLYRFIIRSKFLSFLSEKIIPFSFVEKVGQWLSSKSRKRNVKRYNEKNEEIRQNFRDAAEVYVKKNKQIDILVCGHSHIKDNYASKNNFLYLNNGYALNEKTFLNIKKNKCEFISLTF